MALFSFDKPKHFIEHAKDAAFADVAYIYAVAEEHVQVAAPSEEHARAFLDSHINEEAAEELVKQAEEAAKKLAKGK